MWPFRGRGVPEALALLDNARCAPDDIIYAELVCDAADIAAALDKTSAEKALAIWNVIANLDAERARSHELVNRARTMAQRAGIATPPTIEQEYEAYLQGLPAEQRCMTQVRYLYRLFTSASGATERATLAKRALNLLAEYEATRALSGKQVQMKKAFLIAVKGDA